VEALEPMSSPPCIACDGRRLVSPAAEILTAARATDHRAARLGVPDIFNALSAAMKDRARLRPLSEIADWIFDLDNTLYPARCNLFAQVDRRIGQFMEGRLGLDPSRRTSCRSAISTNMHDAGRLMAHHAVDPEAFCISSTIST